MARSTWQQALVSAVLVALAGCATPTQVRMERDVDALETRAHDQMAAHRPMSLPYYEEVDEIWIGGAGVKNERDDRTERLLKQEVVFNRGYPVTLVGIAEFVTTSYGLPVRVTFDAEESAKRVAINPGTQYLQMREAMTNPQDAQGMVTSQPTDVAGFVIRYSGTLEGFLDLVAARTANGWKIEDGRVTIYNRDTRVFTVDAIPGDSRLTNTISNQQQSGAASSGGSGAGAAGGQSTSTSGNKTETNAEIDVYKSIESTVTKMLTDQGKAEISPTLRTVIVTDTAYVLDRVGAFLDQINHQVRQQVAVEVQVLSVEINETESYGIDWNAVWSTVDSGVRAVTQLGASPTEGVGTVGLTIVDPTANFSGSSAVISALSKLGRVSIDTSQSQLTMSGQPATFQEAEETAYVARRSVVALGDNATEVTTELGMVPAGFSITALPVVLQDSEVLMQLQVALRQLKEIRQVGSLDARIEAPQVGTSQMQQQVRLRSGSTLVLTGFVQDRVGTDAQGVGNAKFGLAGGGRNGDRRRKLLVLIVTPRITG